MLSYERRHLGLLGHHKRLSGGENLVGVPRLIFDDTTNHANVNAAETLIITVPIAARTLRATGDFLEYIAEFGLQGPGNSKTLRYKFGGQGLNAAPWNNTLSSTQFVQIGRIYRTSPTTCRSYISNTLP